MTFDNTIQRGGVGSPAPLKQRKNLVPDGLRENSGVEGAKQYHSDKYNCLINPLHPDFKSIAIGSVQSIHFNKPNP
jgi:hypothetical protein